MVGSVQEIYERYLRTAERRYPMVLILTRDGNDTSQRITDKGVNELLNGLTTTGVLVNGVLLSSSGVSLVRSIVLEMVKRTGGAHESVVAATALSGRMKMMAGRIAQQYKQVSPERAPAEEFKRLAPKR